MMNKLFTDDLLKDYSAHGVREKKGFAQYVTILEVIWKAVKLVYPESKFEKSVKDVLGNIGVNLKHAPGRIKSARTAKEKKTSVLND